MILKDRFLFILGDPVWKICCVLDLLIASRTAPGAARPDQGHLLCRLDRQRRHLQPKTVFLLVEQSIPILDHRGVSSQH